MLDVKGDIICRYESLSSLVHIVLHEFVGQIGNWHQKPGSSRFDRSHYGHRACLRAKLVQHPAEQANSGDPGQVEGATCGFFLAISFDLLESVPC